MMKGGSVHIHMDTFTNMSTLIYIWLFLKPWLLLKSKEHTAAGAYLPLWKDGCVKEVYAGLDSCEEVNVGIDNA